MSKLHDDLMASLAGASVLQACGGPKKVASAAGVDDSQGRRYVRGEPANPVNRTRAMIERAQDPWAIVSYLVACAVRVELQRAPMVEWRWRSLYHAALEAEQAVDGGEDAATQRLLLGKASLADQIAADSQVASATIRRIALAIIGQHHGWAVTGPKAH